MNNSILNQIMGWKGFSITRENNDLKLDNLKVIKNKKKHMIVILAESRFMLEEIHVIQMTDKIIIQSIVDTSTGKAYSINTVQSVKNDLLTGGNFDVLISEIKMDKKYYLNLKSYGLARRGLIKIVLDYTPYHFGLN